MHEGNRIAAVLPAYNEARYVAAAVQAIPRSIVDDVIVIDDASTDGTGALASAAGADVVESLSSNRGVGYAIKHGWRLACDRGADVAVIVPGDGQADLTALPLLLGAIEAGADLVIGDRITGRDPKAHGMPLLRLWGSRTLALLTWVSTGAYVADPQSGYQAVSRRLLTTVRLDELADRWGTHNDLISHCALAGLKITTVPVRPIYFAADGERFSTHWRMGDVVRRNLRVQMRALQRRILQRLGRSFYPATGRGSITR